MPNNIDPSATANFECPTCGHEINEPVGRMQDNPNFTCPECGQTFNAAQLVADIQDADKQIDGFLEEIGNL
jgi:predicted RNA-binding Zn-ribbon protein involved in translation (DUF1610 family)